MDVFNYATCSLFTEICGVKVYLGEDDEVITDYENLTLQDNFDGTWASLGGMPLCIETVSVSDDKTVFTCPILLNGKQTNLRIEYDYTKMEWKVVGAWAGIDPETGAASREVVRLKDGDVITPLYYATVGSDSKFVSNGDYTVNGNIDITYEPLNNGRYIYSMTLYDIYGNYYFTNEVTFILNENGNITFNREELE